MLKGILIMFVILYSAALIGFRKNYVRRREDIENE